MSNVKGITLGKTYKVLEHREATRLDHATREETHLVTVENDEKQIKQYYFPTQLKSQGLQAQLVDALQALGLGLDQGSFSGLHINSDSVIIEMPCHSVEFCFSPDGSFKGVFIQ